MIRLICYEAICRVAIFQHESYECNGKICIFKRIFECVPHELSVSGNLSILKIFPNTFNSLKVHMQDHYVNADQPFLCSRVRLTS